MGVAAGAVVVTSPTQQQGQGQVVGSDGVMASPAAGAGAAAGASLFPAADKPGGWGIAER